MPYMALLRHLVTLQRRQVFDKYPETARYVALRLANTEALHKARVLPFRLWSAYQQFIPHNSHEELIQEALNIALTNSANNMPPINGRVCIAPDVSGSMTGRISEKSETRFVDIAGIFAGSLMRMTTDAIVLPFNHQVLPVTLNTQADLMHNAQQIQLLLGGGTAISAPIDYLLEHKISVDVFIGITDNEEWVKTHHQSWGFLGSWLAYQQEVNPNAQAFLLTIAPYRAAVAPPQVKGVHYLYGWNESVLRYISQTVNHDESAQVKHVAQLDLPLS